MSRCLSKKEQMERSESIRMEGDISKDGYGGFTLDSVFCDERNGEKWVTSCFRLTSEVEAEKKPEEKENWNPEGFNFQAAIGGSSSEEKSREKASPEKVRKDDHLNGKDQARKVLEDFRNELIIEISKEEERKRAFESHYLDILMDVTDTFEEMTKTIKCDFLKDKMGEDITMTESNWEKTLKEHGEECDCKVYFRGLFEYYNILSHFPLEILEKAVQMNEEEKMDKMKTVMKQTVDIWKQGLIGNKEKTQEESIEEPKC